MNNELRAISSGAERASEARIEPDAERMKRYQTRYEIYKDIYPAVNPIHRRL